MSTRDMATLGVQAPTDPLERLIVETIYEYRAEQRIYPDVYAADLASRIKRMELSA